MDDVDVVDGTLVVVTVEKGENAFACTNRNSATLILMVLLGRIAVVVMVVVYVVVVMQKILDRLQQTT